MSSQVEIRGSHMKVLRALHELGPSTLNEIIAWKRISVNDVAQYRTMKLIKLLLEMKVIESREEKREGFTVVVYVLLKTDCFKSDTFV
jgi:hypothetical protein